MKSKIFFGLLSCLFVPLMLICHGEGLVRAQNQAQSKGAAIFKVPDGYMQAPMGDLRGMFALDPKKPAGMFVSYPNDNENTFALRQRILRLVLPMFIHAEKGSETATTWETTPLPSHPNDGDGKAEANIYRGAKEEVQVVIYECSTSPAPFLYGYFAMRHTSPKGDDGKFLDESGKGVKSFDKLWQSFPK